MHLELVTSFKYLIFLHLIISLSTTQASILEDGPRHIRSYRLKRSYVLEDAANASEEESSSEEDELEPPSLEAKLRLPEGYNKLALPIAQGKIVYVYVSLFIRQVLEIDEKNEELSLDVDLGMRWVDWKIYQHLSSTDFIDPITNKTIGNITLDSDVLKQIWKPDIFIDELAGVEKDSIFSKLVTLKFLGKTKDKQVSGDIVLSARMTLRLKCGMDFTYYPADTHECSYVIRSYSYPDDELRLYWSPVHPVYLHEPHDPNFYLQVSSIFPENESYINYVRENFNEYRRGDYSALKFVIMSRRKLEYHLVLTYLPSVLLIFIAWLSFLIPWHMVEVRIAISMTTLLTLTAMFAGVRQQSPAVSYTMAIDVWMVFCIFFVFVALLTFTSIYWVKLRLKRLKENGRGNNGKPRPVRAKDGMVCKGFVIWTKKWAFWTFALIFIIFFVTYWVWLTTSSKYFDWEVNPEYNAIPELIKEDPAKNLYRYCIYRRKSRDNVDLTDDNSTAGWGEIFDDFSSEEMDPNVETILNGTTNNDTGSVENITVVG